MIDKKVALRVGTRAGLTISLLAAGLTGAVLATQLQPAAHVVAALKHTQAPAATHQVAHVAARPPAVLAPPVRAMVTTGVGPAVATGAWVHTHAVTLRVELPIQPAAATLRAEAELVPTYQPFDGQPTAQSADVALTSGQQAEALIYVTGLQNGVTYHWHVRTHSATGAVSAWSGGSVFGINTTAPASPQIVATNVARDAWGQQDQALFRWTDTSTRIPIAYYQYATLRGAAAPPAAAQWQRARGSVLSLSGLAQGYWHLYVRAVDEAGNISAPTDWGFGVAHVSPPAPTVAAERPSSGSLANTAVPSISWQGTHVLAPITAYEYAVLPGAAQASSAVWTLTTSAHLALPALADGPYTVLVRSVDAAGNRSQPLRWHFVLDRRAPQIGAVSVSATSFTPPAELFDVSYALSKTAIMSYTVTQAGSTTPLLHGTLNSVQAGPKHNFVWTGRLSGNTIAPAGTYTVSLEATDAAGNHSAVVSNTVSLSDQRIVVSLSKEELWAYQGSQLVLKTPVTNGGPNTPTIPGIFHVLGKYPNFVFHSPWPVGSPLWYPDSPTSFALLYQASGGYFIHDSPWRSVYGPGSNSLAGAPGGNYTGSHGCTNVPYDPMKILYSWANVGTLVQIVK